MEEVRIPNDATYTPFSLTDVITVAPLASRLILGATLPGRVLSAAAFGYYAGSAVKDWARRRDVRRVDFQAEFGADVDTLEPMPEDARRKEARALTVRLNAGFVPDRPERRDLARLVDDALTDYLAGITGQRVRTSREIRGLTLAGLALPFATGACDMVSGDVAIFRDPGVFLPHVIGHEFVHRKGYWKELHAQALSYLALVSSGDPVLVQAALVERLYRQLGVLADGDEDAYRGLVERSGLRDELRQALAEMPAATGGTGGVVGRIMRDLYDQRLRMSGQNGISDYGLGFTNFLWTFSRSATARQDRALAQV